ncbi:uncharacterized protein STEHIDRAFT_164125 [Stereum hirsutum FP-91666 SS1]|uniref:Uncharacterized protein n=1 Tax=Stereum hirsutum (strain FP-91666) TaxID=721885 RepID=R7RX81_STEHR|nr:uncharacterized protein STEHIDRAFT_164125 [Stereum hirsutum FP-91666 SS1]EIM78987.1 hypothetical protein STEHIDRAFT_164125 [Stereum hirsutum FP-91666 SS1]
MAESWAWEPSKKPTAKELRTSQQVKDFAICVECLLIAVDEGCLCCGNNSALSFLFFSPSSPLLAAPPSPRRRSFRVPPTRPEYQRSHMTAVLNGWLHSPTRRCLTPLGMPHYFGESLLAEVQGFELAAKVEGKEWEAEFKKEKARKKAEKAAKKAQRMDVAAAITSTTKGDLSRADFGTSSSPFVDVPLSLLLNSDGLPVQSDEFFSHLNMHVTLFLYSLCKPEGEHKVPQSWQTMHDLNRTPVCYGGTQLPEKTSKILLDVNSLAKL